MTDSYDALLLEDDNVINRIKTGHRLLLEPCFLLYVRPTVSWLTTCNTIAKPHVREHVNKRCINQMLQLCVVFAQGFQHLNERYKE